jgi:hypothetical protein
MVLALDEGSSGGVPISVPVVEIEQGFVTIGGGNFYGELGNGTTARSPVPIAVSGITNATAISAGGYSHREASYGTISHSHME